MWACSVHTHKEEFVFVQGEDVKQLHWLPTQCTKHMALHVPIVPVHSYKYIIHDIVEFMHVLYMYMYLPTCICTCIVLVGLALAVLLWHGNRIVLPGSHSSFHLSSV